VTEPPNGDHERWEGDAAAYALHALPANEAQAFEEHLAACRRCQDELAILRDTVTALPAAVPPLAPPPELKQRVMATVRAEADARTGSQATAGPKRPARRRPWLGNRPSWLQPGVAIAAAVVVLLVVVGVLTLGGGSSVRTFTGVVHAPGATASVRESGNGARLRFSSLPAPPAGRIYQVWLKRPGTRPQPTRTLFAASSGSVAVTGNLRGIEDLLVTAEPRPNGSTAPTRPPIIVVRLA
jgi:anti-sigma-K factor RskA